MTASTPTCSVFARRNEPAMSRRADHLCRAQPRAVPRLPRLHARDARDPEAPAEGAHRDRRRRRGQLLAAPAAGPDLPRSACCARSRARSTLARALHRPHSLRRLPRAAAPLVGARLPDLSVRAVLVAARGHVGRLPGRRLAHAAGGGGDPRRRERPAHRFLLDGEARQPHRRSPCPMDHQAAAERGAANRGRALRPEARLPAGAARAGGAATASGCRRSSRRRRKAPGR